MKLAFLFVIYCGAVLCNDFKTEFESFDEKFKQTEVTLQSTVLVPLTIWINFGKKIKEIINDPKLAPIAITIPHNTQFNYIVEFLDYLHFIYGRYGEENRLRKIDFNKHCDIVNECGLIITTSKEIFDILDSHAKPDKDIASKTDEDVSLEIATKCSTIQKQINEIIYEIMDDEGKASESFYNEHIGIRAQLQLNSLVLQDLEMVDGNMGEFAEMLTIFNDQLIEVGGEIIDLEKPTKTKRSGLFFLALKFDAAYHFSSVSTTITSIVDHLRVMGMEESLKLKIPSDADITRWKNAITQSRIQFKVLQDKLNKFIANKADENNSENRANWTNELRGDTDIHFAFTAPINTILASLPAQAQAHDNGRESKKRKIDDEFNKRLDDIVYNTIIARRNCETSTLDTIREAPVEEEEDE